MGVLLPCCAEDLFVLFVLVCALRQVTIQYVFICCLLKTIVVVLQNICFLQHIIGVAIQNMCFLKEIMRVLFKTSFSLRNNQLLLNNIFRKQIKTIQIISFLIIETKQIKQTNSEHVLGAGLPQCARDVLCWLFGFSKYKVYNLVSVYVFSIENNCFTIKYCFVVFYKTWVF